MKNRLSEGTLRLISARGIEETIVRLPQYADDYLLLNTVFEENKKANIIRRNCQACKKNFKPGGPQSVCEAHYHDYCDCMRENCLFCLFVRSIGFNKPAGFYEVDRVYAEGNEEEKDYVRGIMKSLDILREISPMGQLRAEIENAGDTIISTGVYENKIYLVYKDNEEDGIFITVFDISERIRKQIFRIKIEEG